MSSTTPSPVTQPATVKTQSHPVSGFLDKHSAFFRSHHHEPEIHQEERDARHEAHSIRTLEDASGLTGRSSEEGSKKPLEADWTAVRAAQAASMESHKSEDEQWPAVRAARAASMESQKSEDEQWPAVLAAKRAGGK